MDESPSMEMIQLLPMPTMPNARSPVPGIVLSILGIAFAASCIWLTVRIINRRKKPGVAFWATVAFIVVLVSYPLSIGPVYSLMMKHYADLPEPALVAVDWYCAPFQWAFDSGPTWLHGPVMRYVYLWL